MPDRHPMPPPAGDETPTPPRGTVRSDAHLQADDGWDDIGDEPNFVVRRALVIGGVVIAAAVAIFAVGWIIGSGDDSGSGSSADATEWNSLVVLSADETRVLDPGSGDERDTYSSDIDLLNAQSLVANDVLITMTDAGAIAQTDLADGSQARGRSGPDESLVISADNSEIAFSGLDIGGDVTIIDTRDRSVLSVADVAGLDDPLIFTADVLVNPSGTHVAVPVPNAFQSVVIDLTNETSQPRAGRVIAIDDEHIVTEQPAGSESEIEFFDLAGERLGSVDVAAPQATLLREDGKLLAVTAAGAITLVDADGGIDEIGTLTDPDERSVTISAGVPTADGQRLVVIGNRNTYVVDVDGNQLAAVPGTPANSPRSEAQCIVVSSTTSAAAANSVVDLTTGEVLVDVDAGFVTSESVDGCTIAFQAGGPKLVHEGEVIEVDADSILAVAPDGTGYAVLDGGDTKYVEIGDDPVEIADDLSVIHFANH